MDDQNNPQQKINPLRDYAPKISLISMLFCALIIWIMRYDIFGSDAEMLGAIGVAISLVVGIFQYFFIKMLIKKQKMNEHTQKSVNQNPTIKRH